MLHQLVDGFVDVLVDFGDFVTAFFVCVSVDVQYAHLLDDGRLAGLGGAQQQNFHGLTKRFAHFGELLLHILWRCVELVRHLRLRVT